MGPVIVTWPVGLFEAVMINKLHALVGNFEGLHFVGF